MLMLLLGILPISAADEKAEPVNATEIVLEHIQDSYDWHITDVGDRHITINLPVIVKSSTGWHVFSTAKFAHDADANGYRQGPFNLAIASKGDYAGKIVELVNGAEVRPFDVSITKTVAVMLINAVILLCFILIPARWYKNRKPSDPAPGGFTGFVEMLVVWVEENVVEAGLSKEDAPKYSPYLMTCFFFIFVCNYMGIVPFPPGSGNVTGNIAVTFFLALCTFIIVQVSGSKAYWKDIFWPNVPLALKAFPLIPVIEFVGIFTKPFALMIRLFANMMAGHAIAVSMICIIFIVAGKALAVMLGMSFLAIVMAVFMMMLELLVCFIQAMVFTTLSSIFIGLARE